MLHRSLVVVLCPCCENNILLSSTKMAEPSRSAIISYVHHNLLFKHPNNLQSGTGARSFQFSLLPLVLLHARFNNIPPKFANSSRVRRNNYSGHGIFHSVLTQACQQCHVVRVPACCYGSLETELQSGEECNNWDT